MKQILITSLQLLNFKGIRSERYDFDRTNNEFRGRNGSGKTSIFDAITWVLFGKDSIDRKDFGIKTLDADGVVIPELPHEVTATFCIDGQQISVRRNFSERWVKPHGKTEREFQGHKEERYINDVPYSVREFDQKIAELFCPSDVFKLITNPSYFCSLRWQDQRNMLIRMAGEISDKDIAASSPDFAAILDALNHGKTVEEYQREIAASKRRVRQELDGIPARIDEERRNSETDVDFADVEARISEKKARIDAIDRIISDANAANADKIKAKSAIQQSISAKQDEINRRKSEVSGQLSQEYYASINRRNQLLSEHGVLTQSRIRNQKSLSTYERRAADLTAERQTLVDEWRGLKNGSLPQWSDDQFVCPTCKRPYDTDSVEQMKQTMRLNALDNNESRGKAISEELKTIAEGKAVVEHDIEEANACIARLESDPLFASEPSMPDTAAAYDADTDLQRLRNQLADLNAQLSTFDIDNDLDPEHAEASLLDEKATLQRDIDRLNQQLGTRRFIEAAKQRIADLEGKQRSTNNELADLEGKEFAIASFIKHKVSVIEARISHLFRFVRFKMFDVQVNGEEVETCEAIICHNGVPYSVANTADRICAGIDIINAICISQQVTAPIVIDNRESVTDIIPTDSQIISLYVDPSYAKPTLI